MRFWFIVTWYHLLGSLILLISIIFSFKMLQLLRMKKAIWVFALLPLIFKVFKQPFIKKSNIDAAACCISKWSNYTSGSSWQGCFIRNENGDVKEEYFPLSMASPFCPGWKAGKSIWLLLSSEAAWKHIVRVGWPGTGKMWEASSKELLQNSEAPVELYSLWGYQPICPQEAGFL